MAPTGEDIQPKMAHVNLMVDTVIANLPEQGLRSVMRSMLAVDPTITAVFEERTRSYLRKTASSVSLGTVPKTPVLEEKSSNELRLTQQTIRSMLGCGMCYESIPRLSGIASQTARIQPGFSEATLAALSSIDGDIIQVLTAIQKTLLTSSGTRPFSTHERTILEQLWQSLNECHAAWQKTQRTPPFERSTAALESLLQDTTSISNAQHSNIPTSVLPLQIETFSLSNVHLPRLFSGLWQLSSPSWGTSSLSAILHQFSHYASLGFTAYDMADHYGDAEVLFGKFRSHHTNPPAIFGATKYCVFTPTKITREVVRANITERCQRMGAEHIDLLQFHWQDYSDKQYIQALEHLQQDPRVHRVGLCNFDTERMTEIIDAGVTICTNQVQFSLIDSRPRYRMGPVCERHDIKLLTYGTLCGGFLSEKWRGRPEPRDLFSNNITPSQRKYYEMILNWGSWGLFQELLIALMSIAAKHSVSISNVATRWVLDFSFVGAVIVGTRWGISDNARDNLQTYGWKLDEEDQNAIEDVLKKSKRDEMIEVLGDCGGEYR